MAEIDPFVQRMMARTKARKNALEKAGRMDKENVLENKEFIPTSDIKKGVEESVKMESGTEKRSSVQNCTPVAQNFILSNISQVSSLSPKKATIVATDTSHTSRFQLLSQRSRQMQEWEDDYTYHSQHDAPKKVENSKCGFSMQQFSSSPTKLHDVRVPESNFLPLRSPSPEKYYYGNSPNASKNITNARSCIEHSSTLKPVDVISSNYIKPPNKISSPHSRLTDYVSSNCPSSHLDNVRTSLKKNNNNAHSNVEMCNTPSRHLKWDKQLLNSLELQGFSPSESRSKLSFDFQRDRSPIKQCPKSINSTVSKEAQQLVPPKIISYHSKSPSASPQKKRINREEYMIPNLDPRPRDSSPSKVNSMTSHWEQQIRSASPDRNMLHRSPSPNKNLEFSPIRQSVARSPSPTKKQELRSNSPVKSIIKSSNKTFICKSQTGFQHDADFKSSIHTPNRTKQSVNIVKGDNAMAEIIPVIDDSARLSVKQRAAAFTSVMAPKCPSKDPAELSVQDRLNIFEKKKSSALIPKAAFGQPVCSKALRSEIEHDTGKSGIHLPNRVITSVASTRNKCIASSKVNFEEPKTLHGDWQSSDINTQVLTQRKEEMNVLLNRFKRPRVQCSKETVTHQVDESETEYPESDESSVESNDNQMTGPPKPPRSFEISPPCSHSLPPLPPMNLSPCKRMNSTELGELNSPSPSKQYVPKIKPGCIFPSLSDIDSNSEHATTDFQESQDEDETKNSSFADSVLTCASINSLGKHIQQVAQSVNAVNHMSMIKERTESSHYHTAYTSQSMDCSPPYLSESVEDAIGAIDDALDEALSDTDDSTPPKRSRKDLYSEQTFKTPKISQGSIDDSLDVSLAHSISMYRRQKPAQINITPVRQIKRKPDLITGNDSPISPSVNISHRIKELQAEAELQLKVISQASSAITCVAERPEQRATPQHVEAEKLLIVATQKRQAVLNEVQRLKAEGALGKKNEDEDSCLGSIGITNIALPLKPDFLNKSVNGLENTTHHILVLVKHRDQVITSQLQATPKCIVEGAVTFPNLMALQNLTADFNISLEVYCFKIEPIPATLKKDQSRMRLTPLKRLQKESKMAASSPALRSPAGPFSIRTSSFALVGFAHLNIHTLTRNAWTLEKVPFNSPLDGHLLMRVSVSMEGGVAEKNFLTMFEDVGGFGSWNRRWCSLSGPYLKYWKYPDDEAKKDCVAYLDMRMCTTRKVELVSRDICARLFTFQLILMRPARKSDRTDLVSEVKDNMFISRVLLSADSKEERILWCNKLNRALANIRAWDPDALRPDDFQV